MIDWLSNPAGQRLTVALVHFLWQGGLIAVGVWLVLRFAPLRSAAARYAVALLALVAMALCPLWTWVALGPIRPWNGPSISHVSHSTATSEVERGQQYVRVERPAEAWSSPSEFPIRMEVPAWLYAGLSSFRQSALSVGQPFLLLIWLTGVALLALRLLFAYVEVLRLRRAVVPLPHSLAGSVIRFGALLGVRASGRVFASSQVCEAAAAGFWKPIVLLPAAWVAELPIDVLEAVIAHELAHIRRFDLWANLFQRLVETLLFYHPAVWWLSHVVREEREMCCDVLAAAALGRRLQYASALERLAHRQPGLPRALAMAFAERSPTSLLRRVRHVLGLQHLSNGRSIDPLGGCVVLLIAVGLALGLHAEDPLRKPAPRQKTVSLPQDVPLSQADAPFAPETPREELLWQAIDRLQREVAALRADKNRMSHGNRDDEPVDREIAASLGQERASRPTWMRTKAGRVFQTYDANRDHVVTIDEWLRMTDDGAPSEARQQRHRQRFLAVERDGDGRISPAEFLDWYRP